jgi:hypothetical protein
LKEKSVKKGYFEVQKEARRRIKSVNRNERPQQALD